MPNFKITAATENQVNFIHDLCVDLCINIATRKSMLQLRYNVEHADKLTKTQASAFLQELLVIREERKAQAREERDEED